MIRSWAMFKSPDDHPSLLLNYVLEMLRESLPSGRFELNGLQKQKIRNDIFSVRRDENFSILSKWLRSVPPPPKPELGIEVTELGIGMVETKVFERKDVWAIFVRRMAGIIAQDPTLRNRKQEWNLLHRASEHAFSPIAFQEACYGKGSVFIIGRTDINAERGDLGAEIGHFFAYISEGFDRETIRGDNTNGFIGVYQFTRQEEKSRIKSEAFVVRKEMTGKYGWGVTYRNATSGEVYGPKFQHLDVGNDESMIVSPLNHLNSHWEYPFEAPKGIREPLSLANAPRRRLLEYEVWQI
jgi:hypothetical protein